MRLEEYIQLHRDALSLLALSVGAEVHRRIQYRDECEASLLSSIEAIEGYFTEFVDTLCKDTTDLLIDGLPEEILPEELRHESVYPCLSESFKQMALHVRRRDAELEAKEKTIHELTIKLRQKSMALFKIKRSADKSDMENAVHAMSGRDNEKPIELAWNLEDLNENLHWVLGEEGLQAMRDKRQSTLEKESALKMKLEVSNVEISHLRFRISQHEDTTETLKATNKELERQLAISKQATLDMAQDLLTEQDKAVFHAREEAEIMNSVEQKYTELYQVAATQIKLFRRLANSTTESCPPISISSPASNSDVLDKHDIRSALAGCTQLQNKCANSNFFARFFPSIHLSDASSAKSKPQGSSGQDSEVQTAPTEFQESEVKPTPMEVQASEVKPTRTEVQASEVKPTRTEVQAFEVKPTPTDALRSGPSIRSKPNRKISVTVQSPRSSRTQPVKLPLPSRSNSTKPNSTAGASSSEDWHVMRRIHPR